MIHVKLFEQFIGEEATTSWNKMMKGVKAGGSGPWSLVAIENKKVVAQKIDIKDKNILPAHFEAMRKEHPKAKIHIEDAGGMVVWNEAIEIDESLSQKDFEKAVKDLAYSMPNHTNYDTDGLPSDEQIMKAMQKYQKGLYKYTDANQKKEAVEMVKQILSESVVNEDKKLDRDAFIALLKDKYKFTFVRTTEDFDGSKGGIWTSGESSPSLGGKKIYNYYGSGAAYELGVLKKFEAAINKLGWYSEWYDAGTMMIWPI